MELIKKSIYTTISLFIIAVLYTIIINVFAQTFFKDSANGSIIYKNNLLVKIIFINNL